MTRRRSHPRSWTRGYRALYRVSSKSEALTFETQKREAIRAAARIVRRRAARGWRGTIDVHAVRTGRYLLIAQVSWSPKRKAPALREL